jgi:hypothetical protein
MAMTPLRHADLPDEGHSPGDRFAGPLHLERAFHTTLKLEERWPRLLKMGDLTGEQ